jgi:uncharacterized protein (DUF2126 family)
VRLLVQHRSRYDYARPAALGPQLIRLRPAQHARARIETYGLTVAPADGAEVRWHQDPFGNHVARVTQRDGTRSPFFEVLVELVVDIHPVNPFDFFVDDRCERVPFAYPAELRAELAPFLDLGDPAFARGAAFDRFLAELPAQAATVPFLAEVNAAVARKIAYVIREEAGIYTPEETLGQGRGSCRDVATLLIALLRSRGLAARFASGYLIQLTDEGMIPDQPRGVSRDVVDLHAWAEVFLPGAGWIGLDATSGLLCGEGHIPLACTASPALAAPLEGTSDQPAAEVSFAMTLGRLGHEPRPTAPYTDETWGALLGAGERIDAALLAAGLALTSGGEPTFNSREHPDLPEWNGEAMGATKWTQGVALAEELRRRLCPGGVLLRRQGKHYPGESLPRWVLEVLGRRDGRPIWRAAGTAAGTPEKLAQAIARELGLADHVVPAYEDPWRFLMEEARLPIDVDPLASDLNDPEERQRLARVLERGLGTPAGFVLPLARVKGKWVSERWRLRRSHIFVIAGESPVGLRLPLASLGGPPELLPPPWLEDEKGLPVDPRQAKMPVEAPATGAPPIVRTALTVEAREGALYVFLPPLPTADDFEALLAAIDKARGQTAVVLEGYGPPRDPRWLSIPVTPDPGVLEVNLPPTASIRDHAKLVDTVFEAALATGLHAEKYLLDGRQAGSGGGNHLTLGGPRPVDSPFIRRPDLLASLVTFVQHHPSLSFLFAGLFVGPTSQAPRVDEARHDTLYELEIALDRAFAPGEAPPYLADLLFRHLLVDLSGNTHRAEVCIDKLWDPQTPYGRQGLVELRAFEMPPHPRMITAQLALVRALVAAFAVEPYHHPLVRWGQTLHDRFLLPTWLWRDLEDVLAFLEARGLGLPADAFAPFLELRCPIAGRQSFGDVVVQVRNALEPWPVLGEEVARAGTARYVDSSMERIEVRVSGLVPERHVVTVNGHTLPLKPVAGGDLVGGVRFRAWAPPHSLHAHLGIHHPIRIDVVDRWGRRSLGACAYHVWHPEGRAFDTPPLTRFEAVARQAQRFTAAAPLAYPVTVTEAAPHADAPHTLDLRRFALDRPMPEAP